MGIGISNRAPVFNDWESIKSVDVEVMHAANDTKQRERDGYVRKR